MQSSFVDIGLERDAFLYVSEVVNTVEEFERLESGDEDDAAPAAAVSAVRRRRGADAQPLPPAGGRRGRSRARSPRPAIARAARTDRRRPKIEDLLKEGQEVLVQVVKEPLGTKGARLTSHVTMPGRFLVFMPTVDHVGVSRKIESREERARLRGIVRAVPRGARLHRRRDHPDRRRQPSRSDDIISDLTYFHQVWTEIRQKMEARRPPALLFQEQSLVTKLLRDLLTEDYTAIRHRRRAGASARGGARRADHAEPAAAREALHEGVPDLRGVRRPGGDRQGAAAARSG